MQSERNVTWSLWVAAVVVVGALLAFGVVRADDGPGVDDYTGSSYAMPADAALEAASTSGNRPSGARLYDRGWWSVKAASEGFVLVHHP